MPTSLLPPPPFVTPSQPIAIPTGTISFAAALGSGSGYTWTLTTNQSGGSINAGTGVYTAGSQYNVTDTVTVTDSYGNQTTRDIRVVDPNSVATLKTIRDECKQRLDLVNSSFVTDPEWNSYIAASAFRLYGKLVTAYGNDYNLADPFIFQTDGLLDRYPLAPDFFKSYLLWVKLDNGPAGWLRIPKYNRGEATKLMLPYQVFYGLRTNLHYRIVGNGISLLPTPTAGQYIRHEYVPRPTKMVNDNDVLDGLAGWEEYVKLDVCIKVGAKREKDVTVFGMQMNDMNREIDEIAENRDAGTPDTVTDVRGQEEGSGNGGGGMW